MALKEARSALQQAAEHENPLDGVVSALSDTRGEGMRAAAVVVTPLGVTLALSGDADVRATLPIGELRLNAEQADAVVTHVLDGSYAQIMLGASGADEVDAWWELSEGAVPGAGVVVDLVPSVSGLSAKSVPPGSLETVPVSTVERPAETTDLPAAPDPEPEDDESDDDDEEEEHEFEAVLLLDAESEGDPSQREPLGALGSTSAASATTVKGLMCSRGHFNHPLSANCAWCGIGMAQASHILVSGERPPLGVLVINGQTTFTLDAGYVIGRQPALDPLVDGVAFRALTLADEQRSVSRIHATLRLDGWDVLVEDQGSAIGTWLIAAQGDQQPVRLAAREPRALLPGDQILIGPHQLTFHSHHLR